MDFHSRGSSLFPVFSVFIRAAVITMPISSARGITPFSGFLVSRTPSVTGSLLKGSAGTRHPGRGASCSAFCLSVNEKSGFRRAFPVVVQKNAAVGGVGSLLRRLGVSLGGVGIPQRTVEEPSVAAGRAFQADSRAESPFRLAVSFLSRWSSSSRPSCSAGRRTAITWTRLPESISRWRTNTR